MATFRQRLAPIQDIAYVFAACVLPIHVWSIINLLKAVETLILHLDAWELIGVIAYTQTVALLESAALLLVVILLGAILPARFLRDRFVAQGTLIVFLTSGCAIAAQYNAQAILAWNLRRLLLWAVLYFASIVVASLLIHRFRKLEQFTNAFTTRLAVLSFVYVLIDLLCVIVVILRNI